jgi:hypothetical protein
MAQNLSFLANLRRKPWVCKEVLSALALGYQNIPVNVNLDE